MGQSASAIECLLQVAPRFGWSLPASWVRQVGERIEVALREERPGVRLVVTASSGGDRRLVFERRGI
jgi:hypothetical protein